MNPDNPIEIVILLLLLVLSIWMIERIIAGAFKTVILALFIISILLAYHIELNGKTKKQKQLPTFNFHDLTDYASFQNKFDLYKTETVNDIKFNYCLLYTSPSPRDRTRSRMPSSA